jgi:16S rRNA processing protein RimM
MKDLLFIGKIKKIHNDHGGVVIKTDVATIDTDFIFVEIDGTYIPFKIEHYEFIKDTALAVKFMYVDDNKTASRIIDHRVFIESKQTEFSSQPDLNGYTIVDENGNIIGIVEKSVMNNNIQLLLDIKREGKDNFYIPYVDEFINNTDNDNKTITVKNLHKIVM